MLQGLIRTSHDRTVSRSVPSPEPGETELARKVRLRPSVQVSPEGGPHRARAPIGCAVSDRLVIRKASGV